MSIFLNLILPLIVNAAPFISLFIWCNLQLIKRSTPLTILVVLILTLLNIPAVLLAVKISDYGYFRDHPNNAINCGEGLLLFFLAGALFGILTFAFGIYFCVRNYKISKLKR